MAVSLNITELREIIASIKLTYEVDFSDFSLMLLKRRIEVFLENNHLTSKQILLKKLSTDPTFFQQFLLEIAVPENEMFRDPTLWKFLRDKMLQTVVLGREFKIFVPETSTGEELFSLCIILDELKLLDDVKITAACHTEKQILQIQERSFALKKMQLNKTNYTRTSGTVDFGTYCEEIRKKAYMKNYLLKNVKFVKLMLSQEEISDVFHLILFRNKMLSYNYFLKEKTLKSLNSKLLPSGFLILGYQESLKNTTVERNFVAVNKAEQIYKKKV